MTNATITHRDLDYNDVVTEPIWESTHIIRGTFDISNIPNITPDKIDSGTLSSTIHVIGDITGTISAVASASTLEASSINPFSYLVYRIGNTIYALNGLTGDAEFSSTIGASTVINYAIDHLTSGRTWNEVITLKGSLDVENTIILKDYLTLDMHDAYLKLGYNGWMFRTEETTVASSNIKMLGGVLFGDKTVLNPGGGCIKANCYFSEFKDMFIDDFDFDGMHIISDGPELARSNFFTNLWVRSPRDGHCIHFDGTSGSLCSDQYITACHLVGAGNNGTNDKSAVYGYNVGHIVITSGIMEQNYHCVHLQSASNCKILGSEMGNSKHHVIFIENTFQVFDGHNIISDNIISSSGKATVDLYDDIHIVGADNDYRNKDNKIIGNSHRGTDSRHCVYLGQWTRYNIVQLNTYQGAGSTIVVDLGLDNEVHYNIGFVTENNGLSTIANGETLDTGLSGTPTYVNIFHRGTVPAQISWNTLNANSVVVYHDAGGSIAITWEGGI